jgi:DNA invertase Pin-like site-specific DNA recombinase
MDAQRAPKRAAIYARVSTADQNSELQLREIQDYASRQGWEIVETYQDTVSGAKASRPGGGSCSLR